MPEGKAGAGAKATGYTEIRNGICQKCHIPFEEFETGEVYEGQLVTVRRCPKCGGDLGELLVAFNSEEAKDYWGEIYQKERIKYAMRHRRDKIPKHLRTGAKPLGLRIKGLEREAKRLQKLNQKEERNG